MADGKVLQALRSDHGAEQSWPSQAAWLGTGATSFHPHTNPGSSCPTCIPAEALYLTLAQKFNKPLL